MNITSVLLFGFLESGRDDYNLINTVDTRGEVLNAMGHLPHWISLYVIV